MPLPFGGVEVDQWIVPARLGQEVVVACCLLRHGVNCSPLPLRTHDQILNHNRPLGGMRRGGRFDVDWNVFHVCRICISERQNKEKT